MRLPTFSCLWICLSPPLVQLISTDYSGRTSRQVTAHSSAGDECRAGRATVFVFFLSPFIFFLLPAFIANTPSSQANEAGDTRASTRIDGGSKTEWEIYGVRKRHFTSLSISSSESSLARYHVQTFAPSLFCYG